MVYPGSEEYEDWLDKHPLRQWMNKNKAKMIDVASITGRTPTMVYQWLRGVSLPSNSWDSLCEMTGDIELASKWAEWMSKK